MKLKYILPVATIASVATAVTPLAASCSCGNSKIILDFEFQGIGSGTGVRANKKINITEGKEYSARIDFSKWSYLAKDFDPDISLMIFIADYDCDPTKMATTLKIKSAKLSYEGTELEYVETTEWPWQKDVPNHYTITEDAGATVIQTSENTVNKPEGMLDMTIIFDESKEKQDFFALAMR